jgi:hypothetical protein
MPNQNMKKSEPEWPLISTNQIPQFLGISVPKAKRLMRSGEWKEGIYVFRMPNSNCLLWNYRLMADYIACSGSTLPHQRSCEKFLAQLASNAA